MPGVSDELQAILTRQVIPWWERYGMERLAVSAKTARGFQAQQLPPLMRVSMRGHQSKRVPTRGKRIYTDTCTTLEEWPEDAQDACRHPMLLCVLKGHASLRIADYVVHCPAGHFVLLRPNIPKPDGSRPHLEEADVAGYCEILHLSLLPGASCISSWVCYSKPDRHWSLHHCLINQQDMLRQFHFFMREMLETPDDYQNIASHSLSNFFLLFRRELNAGNIFPALAAGNEKLLANEDNAIHLAQEYMSTHLHHQLTISKVAAAVFMSRTNFLRHFSLVTGQSFNQYLTQLRLERARQQLAERLTVRVAGENVGMKPSQFYRIFKKHLGVSPSQFQRSCLKKTEMTGHGTK